MNVCIDVGNTTIAMGFYKKDEIQCKMVHNTIVNRTEDEYVVLLDGTLSFLLYLNQINSDELYGQISCLFL